MGEGSGIALSCGVGCRLGSDPALLWLWLAATAPIRPLVRELRYAAGVAPKKKKNNNKMIQIIVKVITENEGNLRFKKVLQL